MNLPNKLSLFRVALVPIIVILFLTDGIMECFRIHTANGDIVFTLSDILVFVLFAVASFTDFLDGKIARSRNLITSFGKFVDPIADKLLVNSMLILFACTSRISVLAVLLMIWRDMIVDGLRMNASAKGKVVAAGMLGKIKTVLQMFAIIFLMLAICICRYSNGSDLVMGCNDRISCKWNSIFHTIKRYCYGVNVNGRTVRLSEK